MLLLEGSGLSRLRWLQKKKLILKGTDAVPTMLNQIIGKNKSIGPIVILVKKLHLNNVATVPELVNIIIVR